MPKLPPVQSFVVPTSPNLTFRDLRSTPREDQRSITERLASMTLALMDETARKPRLCEPRILSVNPRVDEGPFTDTDLPVLDFGVYDGRELIGAFGMYDIEIESEDGKTTATSKACPSIPLRGWSANMRVIMRHIVENDITFEGGRVLDIVGWNFPEQSSQQWKDRGSDENSLHIDDIFVDLEDAGHPIERRPDGLPLKVRRRRGAR